MSAEQGLTDEERLGIMSPALLCQFWEEHPEC